MKKLIIPVLALVLASCAKEQFSESQVVLPEQELTFTAGFEELPTRTERQDDKDVYWCPGDAVSLFFNSGDNGGSRFISQNVTVSKVADFKGTITGFAGGGESTGGDFWFWGVYPYSKDNSCDGSTVTLNLTASQIAKAGSFANGLFPSMARSKGLELGFYNICGGFKFSVSRSDINAVKFRGNANEYLAGTARVKWDEDGYPMVSEHIDGKKEIIVSAPDGGTFEPGVFYYIVFFPEFLSEGFTVTFYTTNKKEGVYCNTVSRQIKRSHFITVHNLDQRVTSWTDAYFPYNDALAEGGTESGLYLGVTYFGSYLTTYPLMLLTEESIIGFNQFIDSKVNLDDETLLYYAVDKSMARLQSSKFPDDLFSVAIITFTDGQDNGSVGWKEDETGNTYYKGDYEKELELIMENSVRDIPVMSYSVGLEQTGVSSNKTFINSLQTISHPSSNYTLATNMSDVNEKFKSIARELSNTIKLQKLVCTIARLASGTRIRFTYDDIRESNNSALYIEGVYYSNDYSLKNIVYSGFTSTSGETVIGVRNNNKTTFTFEGIHRENNSDVNMDYYKFWIYNPDTEEWEQQVESSYQEGENGIKREIKSAAIILNLDCTASLGESNFNLLKRYSKDFVSLLYSSSIDPEAVQRVYLDKSSIELVIGESDMLKASISPSSAIEKAVTWTSDKPEIASVDASGRIVAKSVGKAKIIVATKDRNKTAVCEVSVIASRPVSSVSLNLSETSLEIGGITQLSATVLPTNATDKSIVWTSSDEDIATVASDGTITALSVGTTTITAISIDGVHSSSCKVNVEYPTTPAHMSLAIKKTGADKKYYIDELQFALADLTGYEVLGLCIKTTQTFILKLNDSSIKVAHTNVIPGASTPGSISVYYTYEYTVTGASANASLSLPSQVQATWISGNMTNINSIIIKYGGTAMSTSANYWTSYVRGDGHYYYYSSGKAPVLDGAGSLTCRSREVINLNQ